jgi:hypothetical protein
LNQQRKAIKKRWAVGSEAGRASVVLEVRLQAYVPAQLPPSGYLASFKY